MADALNIDHFGRGQHAYISGKSRDAHGYPWHANLSTTLWLAGYDDAAHANNHMRASLAHVELAQGVTA